MKLEKRVKVARRFLKAVRIDTDLSGPESLDGFICPQSSEDILFSMVKHIDSGQGAFTWTGPFGSGKSSLVVAPQCVAERQSSISGESKKDIWA